MNKYVTLSIEKNLLFLPLIFSFDINIGSEEANDEKGGYNDDRDLCSGVFGFTDTNECFAERAEVGEPPEAGETTHQAGDEPGATEAAEDGEAPARGGDLTVNIRHNLGVGNIGIINSPSADYNSPVCNKTSRTPSEAQIQTPNSEHPDFLG